MTTIYTCHRQSSAIDPLTGRRHIATCGGQLRRIERYAASLGDEKGTPGLGGICSRCGTSYHRADSGTWRYWLDQAWHPCQTALKAMTTHDPWLRNFAAPVATEAVSV